MRYLSVTEIAKNRICQSAVLEITAPRGVWAVRFLPGKTWNIPENAEKLGVPAKKRRADYSVWIF